MKREKTKTAIFKKATKVGARRRLTPKNPDALTATGSGQPFVAGTCLPDGQAGTSSSVSSETIANAGKTELEPGGSEFPQNEEISPSSLHDSSDTLDALPDEAASAGGTLQRLAFILGNEEYGIDIRMVK